MYLYYMGTYACTSNARKFSAAHPQRCMIVGLDLLTIRHQYIVSLITVASVSPAFFFCLDQGRISISVPLRRPSVPKYRYNVTALTYSNCQLKWSCPPLDCLPFQD